MITRPIGQQRDRTRRRMACAQVAGLVLLTLAGAGCNTRDAHDADAGVNGSITDLDGVIDQLARSMCAWQFRCCSLPEIDAIGGSAYLTESACRTATGRQLGQSLAEVRLAIESGRMSIDPQASSACAAQFDTSACNSPAGNPNTQPSSVWDRLGQCPAPFVGKVPLKGACSLPSECRPGSSCGGAVRITDGGLRSPPLMSDETLNVPAHCLPDTKEGESCLSTAECTQGLYCRRTDLVCARPAAEDQPCSEPRDSIGQVQATFVACADSPRPLICVSERCRHSPRQDEPCLPSSGVLPVCDLSNDVPLTCVGQEFNGTGICKRLGQQGDDCSTGSGVAPCAVPLSCQVDETGVGTCQAAPPAGSPCSLDSYCAPPAVCYLSTQTCLVPPTVPDGTPCTSDVDCASFNCAPSSAATGGMGVCVPQNTAVCIGPGATAVGGPNPPTDITVDAGVVMRTDGPTSRDARATIF